MRRPPQRSRVYDTEIVADARTEAVKTSTGWQSQPPSDYSEVADHLAAGRELRAGSQPTENGSGWPRRHHCMCHCCTISCLRKPTAHLRSLGTPPCASETDVPPRCSISRAACLQWPAPPAGHTHTRTICNQKRSLNYELARDGINVVDSDARTAADQGAPSGTPCLGIEHTPASPQCAGVVPAARRLQTSGPSGAAAARCPTAPRPGTAPTAHRLLSSRQLLLDTSGNIRATSGRWSDAGSNDSSTLHCMLTGKPSFL